MYIHQMYYSCEMWSHFLYALPPSIFGRFLKPHSFKGLICKPQVVGHEGMSPYEHTLSSLGQNSTINWKLEHNASKLQILPLDAS
jgi:hypothetical protein